MACYVRRVQAGRQEHRRGYSARQRRILENIWHFFIKAFSFSRSSSNSNDSDALYVVAVREIWNSIDKKQLQKHRRQAIEKENTHTHQHTPTHTCFICRVGDFSLDFYCTQSLKSLCSAWRTHPFGLPHLRLQCFVWFLGAFWVLPAGPKIKLSNERSSVKVKAVDR